MTLPTHAYKFTVLVLIGPRHDVAMDCLVMPIIEMGTLYPLPNPTTSRCSSDLAASDQTMCDALHVPW